MGSSIFLMGPLMARCGEVTVSKPGGCVIGQRPIDFHLRGLRALGARIEESHGLIRCQAKRLVGTHIVLDFPSVGATENLLMAAVLADGITIIENAAREPEVEDLANFLNAAGAEIRGAGSARIEVHGRSQLSETTYAVIPDRIVAGTVMAMAAAAGGEVKLVGARADHLGVVLQKLRDAGVRAEVEHDIITVICEETPSSVDIRTAPYPGFPTDLQAPFMAFLTIARGTSIVQESVFEARFKHVDELVRMGANVSVDLRTAIVRGVPRLSGARVAAADLRGGAALVVAGLAAHGVTEVEGLQHIDRGYEDMTALLRTLGARALRVQSGE
ncbi:UDP-N-acetylglucosamine 1-carboxyvinyltransferase [Alicyclobacillus mali]|uniref:UDP-N-acetylglucosamine 1-carboxyvinyltransferase n=1 Tax=Alicyclobacillus mali (ex Roth et al. 2021) TaxID=1123961 RepID=A0ABS0F2S2_9BACL|nr:UDP-N-acetylglucosamine 1-carboxyvinyltransferase [Alicyclobacillus mali (ex Roth et al. 2021)]MCL6489102.1 UDP-N-acetylglucosamine 1-carboxyvinyltransferase [Alicyclobacillus mali (ex Roth et al. 2021)]